MVKFATNGSHGSKIINLPTEVEEITPEYLKAVTDDVKIADNYVLVALCYREKLSNIIMTAKQNKNSISSSVIPLFVKSGAINNKESFINKIKTGTKLNVSSSALSLGLHINFPKNTLNVNTLIYYIDKDAFAYKRAVELGCYVHFLEFKIIPANEIIAFRTNVESDFESPFTIEDNDSEIIEGILN